MGKITIVNALGVDVKLIQGSPYNFNSTSIQNGASVMAEVNTDFDRFVLIIKANEVEYMYDLNRDHWYGGDGENHYPNKNSKINIILSGDRGNYIETHYSYGANDNTTICKYGNDTKALDKQ